jgi:hypothetical protein
MYRSLQKIYQVGWLDGKFVSTRAGTAIQTVPQPHNKPQFWQMHKQRQHLDDETETNTDGNIFVMQVL